MRVIYLTDNDIVEKLAVCDLLDDTLAAYEATRSDVCVVPTLRYRIDGKAKARAERRLGEAAVARILDFLQGVQEIRDYSSEDHALLADIDEIDAGEVVLLAATATAADFLLMTGDKRCLRKLATCPECHAIAARVQSRVVCLEQMILRLIDRFGFDHVLSKIVPVLFGCDTALRAAFGSGIHSTESNVTECLQDYINELRGLPIDMLIVGY